LDEMAYSTVDWSFLRRSEVRKRIALIAAAGAAAGLTYGLLAPKWYRSVLTVVPAKSQKPALSGLLSGVPDLAGFDQGALTGAADAARIAAVLQSLAVTDAAIDKFDLKNRYQEKYLENTRDELWSHCDVKALPKPNLVQLSCEDKDPRFVQELLTFFGDHGNKVFRRVSTSTASEEVRALDKRVLELRERADAASARMRDFQEKHQIVDLETQTKAVVTALASLQSQRISKQLELDYARTFSSRDEATLQQLQSQLSVVERKLRDLENPAPASGYSLDTKTSLVKDRVGGLFPAALEVPKLRAEFENLYRDRKVAEASLVFALERYEAAAATEARDVSTFVVLDAPALPTRKSRPKRLFILLLSTFVAAIAAASWEWWKSTPKAPALIAIGPSDVDARRRVGGSTHDDVPSGGA
jgi:capsule polysaccharide export protein KpsE/RkpR